ncbi:hypothetical protein [Pajaroellobacter abortibovis]|uniref:Uncharacterized protein n=1 Tax=Pajaroellobacter abortibovis TaxID=1882918 RepID=A0A1L6MVL2_9BACT|nr:hypothetical protein [Pajaroellobacter abortibovis]APR99580.1 hypothetical protein BCY86_01955 [Pajaroellobacter abortibovis]
MCIPLFIFIPFLMVACSTSNKSPSPVVPVMDEDASSYNEQDDASSHNEQDSGSDGYSPPPQERDGAAPDIKKAQQEFLSLQRIRKDNPSDSYNYQVNAPFVQFVSSGGSISKVPVAPFVHAYDYSMPHFFGLVIRFTPDFFPNVPPTLQAALAQYGELVCDIYFVAQSKEIQSDTPSTVINGITFYTLLIRPHHWMDDYLTRHLQGQGPPWTCYADVGIFEDAVPSVIYPQHPSAVPLGGLRSFSVSSHDQTLSPDNAWINVDKNELQVFWMLVVDTTHRRAAAVLHALLPVDNDLFLKFNNYIQYGISTGGVSKGKDPATETLPELVQVLERSPEFGSTPLLVKLKALLGM